MKKIIATIATLLALSMAFVGCNKDGGDDTAKGSDTNTPAAPAELPTLCTIEYNAQYSGATTVVKSDWVSVKYVFKAEPSEVQFIYQDSVANPNDQWGNPYCAYSGALTGTEVEVVLADALNQLKTQDSGNPDATAVAKLVLQNSKAGANTVVISSITTTKADGSTEVVEAPAGDWGCSINK